MLSLVKDENETKKDEAVSKGFDTNSIQKRRHRVPKVMPPLKEGEWMMGIGELIRHKVKTVKEVALDEIEQIQSESVMTEGKRRFNEKAMAAFQRVAKCKDLRKDNSAKMIDASRDILLYYVAMYFPDVTVEIDDNGKVVIAVENMDPEDKGFYILRYLIEEWQRVIVTVMKTTPFELMLRIFPGL